jgi:hypothetical protein
MAVEAIRVVQFLHPGGEHRPDRDGRKPWNSGRHRRTFAVQPGRLLRTIDSRPEHHMLQRWCEWESEAEVVKAFGLRQKEYPRHLFSPRLHRKANYSGLANTDPCVFGECFRYCVCQQPSRPSLRQLGRGSVILFGSHLSGSFVLDTAFVVARSFEYRQNDHKSLRLPESYRVVALAPLRDGCGKGDAFRLYEGATPEDPVGQMFSFFPCLPAECAEGFPRPTIDLPGIISPSLKQGIKGHGPMTIDQATELWRDVVQQVVEQELQLGISAEIPLACDG